MNRLSTFLIALSIFLLALVSRSCNNARDYKAKSESYLNLIEMEQQGVEKWKDKEGKSRARAETAEATAEAVSAFIPELQKEIERLKKDNSNLRAYISATTYSSGEVSAPLSDTVVIIKTDTVKIKKFSYTDKWSKFEGSILSNEINFKYLVKDSITFTSYLKGKKLVLEGVSHNPNTELTGLRHIEVIQPKKKKLSFGPTISYGLGNDGQFTWNIGLGVQWKLFEL